MKSSKVALVGGITAAADIKMKRFVGFDGNYCGAGAKALGVSNRDTGSGNRVPLDIYGISVVETGGAIVTAGQNVASDSTGRAVVATAFSVSTSVTFPTNTTPVTSDSAHPTLTATSTPAGSVLPQAINGQALDTAGGAGEFVRVVLR